MRILLDNIIFSLQRAGGISAYWSELACGLADRGHELLCIEAGDAESNLFRGRWRDVAGAIRRERLPWRMARYLAAPVKGMPGSVFHSSYYRNPASRIAPVVQTVHDFTYERFWKGAARRVHIAQKQKALLRADAIICVSESTRKDLQSHCPGVDMTRVRVIHHGCSAVFRKIADWTEAEAMRAAVGHSRYLLYVGTRCGYKNFPVAVETASRSQEHTLVLVGGGPLSSTEIRFLDSRLSGRWRHERAPSQAHLNGLYNFADALLYPSSYEGFGMPLLEAMSAECPVIAVAASSIPEVAGDAALLLPTADAGLMLDAVRSLESNACRRHLVDRGTRNARRFTWQKCVSETEALYRQLAGVD